MTLRTRFCARPRAERAGTARPTRATRPDGGHAPRPPTLAATIDRVWARPVPSRHTGSRPHPARCKKESSVSVHETAMTSRSEITQVQPPPASRIHGHGHGRCTKEQQRRRCGRPPFTPSAVTDDALTCRCAQAWASTHHILSAARSHATGSGDSVTRCGEGYSGVEYADSASSTQFSSCATADAAAFFVYHRPRRPTPPLGADIWRSMRS